MESSAWVLPEAGTEMLARLYSHLKLRVLYQALTDHLPNPTPCGYKNEVLVFLLDVGGLSLWAPRGSPQVLVTCLLLTWQLTSSKNLSGLLWQSSITKSWEWLSFHLFCITTFGHESNINSYSYVLCTFKGRELYRTGRPGGGKLGGHLRFLPATLR